MPPVPRRESTIKEKDPGASRVQIGDDVISFDDQIKAQIPFRVNGNGAYEAPAEALAAHRRRCRYRWARGPYPVFFRALFSKPTHREQDLADRLERFSNIIGPRSVPVLCRLAAQRLISLPHDLPPDTDLARAVGVFVAMESEPCGPYPLPLPPPSPAPSHTDGTDRTEGGE